MKQISADFVKGQMKFYRKELLKILEEDKQLGLLVPYERALHNGGIIIIDQLLDDIEEHQKGKKKPGLTLIKGGLKDR